jgi:hypothetical protein
MILGEREDNNGTTLLPLLSCYLIILLLERGRNTTHLLSCGFMLSFLLVDYTVREYTLFILLVAINNDSPSAVPK